MPYVTASVAGDGDFRWNADVGDNDIVRCVAVVTVPYRYEAATPIIGRILGPITIQGQSRFPVSINCDSSTCPYGS